MSHLLPSQINSLKTAMQAEDENFEVGEYIEDEESDDEYEAQDEVELGEDSPIDNNAVIEENVIPEPPEVEKQIEEENPELELPKQFGEITLSEETVAPGLSCIGKTANGLHFAYTKLSLCHYESMQNVEMIENYPHLQNLELVNNNLTELNFDLPALVRINASHNKLTCLLTFKDEKKRPMYLQEAYYGFNKIVSIDPAAIEYFKYLRKLNLENNMIEDASPLNSLKNLRDLNLNNNRISSLRGIDGLTNLVALFVNNNFLQSVEGLSPNCLEVLHIANNKLGGLRDLALFNKLQELDLRKNIIHPDNITLELRVLSKLPLLRVLWFLSPEQEQEVENASEWKHVMITRPVVLYMVPQLDYLDDKKVDVEAKVQAANQYGQADARPKQMILKKYFSSSG